MGLFFSQAEKATEVFTAISQKDGLFAALFVLLLGIVSFAAWKLSGFGWKIVELWRKDREEIERHSREFGDRVASAVEAQVSIGERHAAIVDAVGETLNAMQSSQETQTEAFMIALDALKEPDDKIRHMLIDQARQKLS